MDENHPALLNLPKKAHRHVKKRNRLTLKADEEDPEATEDEREEEEAEEEEGEEEREEGEDEDEREQRPSIDESSQNSVDMNSILAQEEERENKKSKKKRKKNSDSKDEKKTDKKKKKVKSKRDEEDHKVFYRKATIYMPMCMNIDKDPSLKEMKYEPVKVEIIQQGTSNINKKKVEMPSLYIVKIIDGQTIGRYDNLRSCIVKNVSSSVVETNFNDPKQQIKYASASVKTKENGSSSKKPMKRTLILCTDANYKVQPSHFIPWESAMLDCSLKIGGPKGGSYKILNLSPDMQKLGIVNALNLHEGRYIIPPEVYFNLLYIFKKASLNDNETVKFYAKINAVSVMIGRFADKCDRYLTNKEIEQIALKINDKDEKKEDKNETYMALLTGIMVGHMMAEEDRKKLIIKELIKPSLASALSDTSFSNFTSKGQTSSVTPSSPIVPPPPPPPPQSLPPLAEDYIPDCNDDDM